MFAGGAKQTALGRGPDQLRAVRAAVSLPIVAIGGITEQLVPEVLAAGADAAAIISDIVMAPDIEGKVRRILALRPS
jgi:thiamine-phosphate pyrophosphorylase